MRSSPAAAVRLALPLLILLAALAACGDPDNPDRSTAAVMAYAQDGVTADEERRAALREEARQDSVAEWEARFGDRVPAPDSIRALYLNAWALASRDRVREFLQIARDTEINAFVLDIKESDSYLTHSGTEIALAKEIGADGRPASNWLPELVDSLKANDIYTIARIVVFKDEMLATKRPDLAIQTREGGVFRDRSGAPWVNPYNRTVWDYHIDIAREALEMGFSELQWDYVRFPDVPTRLYETMVFPGADGVSRAEIIRDFVEYSQRELAEYQVPITADVFGLVTHVTNDLGIGQQWEMLSAVADVLLPMVYPSHYYAGSYGISHPNAEPYRILRISMEEARLRNGAMRERGQEPARIVPWLQAFSAPWVDDIRYGATHLREQIQATYDAGLTDWVLWHPGSRYAPYMAAFRGADGSPSELERQGWTATVWDPPAGRLSPMVAQNERERREANERLDRLTEGLAPAGSQRSPLRNATPLP